MSKLNETLFESAKSRLVGGVNSPVRSFSSVGGTPIFFKSGKGSHLIAEDGKTYIDYVQSWGPLILGHAYPTVVESIQQQSSLGTSFGAPSQLETELASLVQSFFTHFEKIRFVNSGTEATMSALRLARGVTNRPVIVKCEGCYHGHSDQLLVSAGSGALTLGSPNSKGVPKEMVAHTRVVSFNDIDQLTTLFQKEGQDIAAVILEPVCGNMGVVPPNPGYLEGVRSLCSDYGSLLVFDEVMSGFRVDLGGAQRLYGIEPDITCLGKVIGGGLPCGAYGGKASIMDQLSPLGPVYQAGTLSGNPLAMAAGIATLSELKNSNAFDRAKQLTSHLIEELAIAFETKRFPVHIQSVGTMFTVFFTGSGVTNLMDAQAADMEQFNRFFHHLLQHGVYFPPSGFEACFMSAVHTEEDIQQTIKAVLTFD